jgi:uncharacterized membrane protein YoaK (UPF0700 family)
MKMAPAIPAPPNFGEPPTPELRSADSLPSAILLAFTGGGLDAFTYLNHGKVFAGAMTGDTVLLGIAVLHGRAHQVLHYVVPLVAFFAGILGAKLLDAHLNRHAVTIGLLGEIVVLFVFSWMPGGFPDMIFLPVVVMAAAYQVASFRSVDNYAYNSTFITGNIRTAADGLYDAFNPERRRNGLHKFRDLALIGAGFVAGATSGAFLAPRWYNHTLWLLDVPLIAVLALALRRGTKAPL